MGLQQVQFYAYSRGQVLRLVNPGGPETTWKQGSA
jgi:hypothetical protein